MHSTCLASCQSNYIIGFIGFCGSWFVENTGLRVKSDHLWLGTDPCFRFFKLPTLVNFKRLFHLFSVPSPMHHQGFLEVFLRFPFD